MNTSRHTGHLALFGTPLSGVEQVAIGYCARAEVTGMVYDVAALALQW